MAVPYHTEKTHITQLVSWNKRPTPRVPPLSVHPTVPRLAHASACLVSYAYGERTLALLFVSSKFILTHLFASLLPHSIPSATLSMLTWPPLNAPFLETYSGRKQDPILYENDDLLLS